MYNIRCEHLGLALGLRRRVANSLIASLDHRLESLSYTLAEEVKDERYWNKAQ